MAKNNVNPNDINMDEELNVLDIVSNLNQMNKPPSGIEPTPEIVQQGVANSMVGDVMGQDYNTEGIENIQEAFSQSNLTPHPNANKQVLNNNGSVSVDNLQPSQSAPLLNPYGEPVDPFGGMSPDERVKLEGEVLKNEKVKAEIDKINNVSNYYRGMGLKPQVDKMGNVYTTDQGVVKYLYMSPINSLVEHSGGTLMFQKGVNTDQPVQNNLTSESFTPGLGPTNLSKDGQTKVGTNLNAYTLTKGSKYPDNFYGVDNDGAPLAGQIVPSDIQVRQIWEVGENGQFTGKLQTVYHGSEASKQYLPQINTQIKQMKAGVDDIVSKTVKEGLMKDAFGNIDYNFEQPAYASYLNNAHMYFRVRNMSNISAYSQNKDVILQNAELYKMPIHDVDPTVVPWKPMKDYDGQYHYMVSGDNVKFLNQELHQGIRWTVDMLGNPISAVEFVNGEQTKEYHFPDNTRGGKPYESLMGTKAPNGGIITDINELINQGRDTNPK